mmetsp:Transcript_2745/g.9287  ORF Transcript_2745/g.9287 Transcript_2745/m.9287 type:complete len:133 (+) Transcript_2745:1408-1806(+)
MIMPTVMRQYELWNTRITTARLNRWLVKVAARNPSGGGGSGEGRIRYITQYKTRPPSFVAWVTGAKDFSDNMSKHIAALMRADFGLDGLPIRVTIRKVSRGESRGSKRRPDFRSAGMRISFQKSRMRMRAKT